MLPNPILLGVNVDHIATIREGRGTTYPCPVEAALLAEKAGADGITVHLREDRRHIQPADVINIRAKQKTRLNLEMAITDAMLEFAQTVRPHYACIVPEKRHELTTEGGLDVLSQKALVKNACQRLGQIDIMVSLFIDPDESQIAAAKECGAPIIEIHTGKYADTGEKIELEKIERAVEFGLKLGLQVNAGHGLNYDNVKPIAAIPGITELNIGHSIVARAMFVGIEQAVKEMLALFPRPRVRGLG